MQIPLRGGQRAVPGDLPQDVHRDTGISHPGEPGVPQVMPHQVLVAGSSGLRSAGASTPAKSLGGSGRASDAFLVLPGLDVQAACPGAASAGQPGRCSPTWPSASSLTMSRWPTWRAHCWTRWNKTRSNAAGMPRRARRLSGLGTAGGSPRRIRKRRRCDLCGCPEDSAAETKAPRPAPTGHSKLLAEQPIRQSGTGTTTRS